MYLEWLVMAIKGSVNRFFQLKIYINKKAVVGVYLLHKVVFIEIKCDQIGRFLIFFAANFVTKLAQIFSDIFGYCEKITFWFKASLATFCAMASKFGLLFHQHLVTLIMNSTGSIPVCCFRVQHNFNSRQSMALVIVWTSMDSNFILHVFLRCSGTPPLLLLIKRFCRYNYWST